MRAPALKVLLTNRVLTGRTGSETYLRDLALALLRVGHRPYVFSPELGPIADELLHATVPVVTDLNELGISPDVIHGNHHPQTMEALMHFRDTPAVFVCHAWNALTSVPPQHPRIRRYVAVDHTCQEKLLTSGIAETKVRVMLNAVDLERFRPRPALPPKPRRALIFTNYAYDTAVIERSCRAAGIELDRRGVASGNSTASPESLLAGYDIVFAKARAAIEAMAVGAAVIICDFRGLGGMVTSERWDEMRRLNFGARTMTSALSIEDVARELDQYDPADAARVSARVRRECSLDALTSDWEELYKEVVEEQESAPRDLDAEGRAAARYLRQWGFDRRYEWERHRMLSLVPSPLVRWLQRRIASKFKPSGA